MRILQVVTLMSPDGAYGGPVTVALNQSVELARRGHSVTICAAARGYSDPPTSYRGVELKLFPSSRVVPKSGFAGMSSPLLLWWARRNLAHFDVIHVHLARDLVTMPVALLAVFAKCGVVVQTHGMIVPDRRRSSAVFDRLLTVPVLRRVFAALYLNARELVSLQGIGVQDLRYVNVPNGVPVQEMLRPSEVTSPKVVFVGRLHPRKNAPMFVAAARTVLDGGLEATFELIGPDEGDGPKVEDAIDGDRRISWLGAMESDGVISHLGQASVFVLPSVDEPYPMGVLEATFELIGPDEGDGPKVEDAIGGDRRISWLGAMESDGVIAHLGQASVFVLPSVDEPYPMGVLEAMSVGLPVIVTHSCGLADFVAEHECGVVVDAATDEVATAILSLLRDTAGAREMGRRGQHAVRTELGMGTVVDTLIGVYLQASV